MADPIDTDAIRDELNVVDLWQLRAWVEQLLPEVDRLRERNLGYARKLGELRAKIGELRAENPKLRKALADLLAVATNPATQGDVARRHVEVTGQAWCNGCCEPWPCPVERARQLVEGGA